LLFFRKSQLWILIIYVVRRRPPKLRYWQIAAAVYLILQTDSQWPLLFYLLNINWLMMGNKRVQAAYIRWNLLDLSKFINISVLNGKPASFQDVAVSLCHWIHVSC